MSDDEMVLAGLRVLVVEDEMLVSMLIEDTLADLECRIVGPFDRVGDALDAARGERLDLALLDINVAGVKIWPVAAMLASRRIPFLFLSGYGRAALPPDQPEWRVCDKPFRPDVLVSMMVERVRNV